MRCKCRLHNSYMDTSEAFKVVVDGKNTYWCDKACYEEYLRIAEQKREAKKNYDAVYEVSKYILNVEPSYSLLSKEIAAWEKICHISMIIAYLYENQEQLRYTMSRQFSSEYGRIRYFGTVIASKLANYKPRVVDLNKDVTQIDMCEYSSVTLNKRRSIEELEDLL